MDTLMTDARWEKTHIRGRCTNRDYCGLGDDGRDIVLERDAVFSCPECNRPLRPLPAAEAGGGTGRMMIYGVAAALFLGGACFAGYRLVGQPSTGTQTAAPAHAAPVSTATAAPAPAVVAAATQHGAAAPVSLPPVKLAAVQANSPPPIVAANVAPVVAAPVPPAPAGPTATPPAAPPVAPMEALTPIEQYRQLVGSAQRLDADLHFETNSNKLDLHSSRAVDRIWNRMISYHYAPDRMVLVGFADNQGTPEANLALSMQRAEAVAAVFTQRGLPPGLVLNLGSALPIGDNDTEAGREQNRRVEVYLRN